MSTLFNNTHLPHSKHTSPFRVVQFYGHIETSGATYYNFIYIYICISLNKPYIKYSNTSTETYEYSNETNASLTSVLVNFVNTRLCHKLTNNFVSNTFQTSNLQIRHCSLHLWIWNTAWVDCMLILLLQTSIISSQFTYILPRNPVHLTSRTSKEPGGQHIPIIPVLRKTVAGGSQVPSSLTNPGQLS